MERKIALKVHDDDNVATLFADNIKANEQIEIRDKRGNLVLINVIGNIPYGHKVALRDIEKGDSIIKYGESLGMASDNIALGEYVHVHNLDSMRGRGDL